MVQRWGHAKKKKKTYLEIGVQDCMGEYYGIFVLSDLGRVAVLSVVHESGD